MTLYQNTLNMIQSYKGNRQQMARDLDISAGWLYLFERDKSPNASIDKVQKLHDYLVANNA